MNRLSDDESNSSFDFDEDDLQEDNSCDEKEPTKCLFCSLILGSVPKAILHCQKIHNFDLHTFKSKFNLESDEYFKFINFVRSQSIDPKTLNQAKTALWKDDNYLEPFDDNDPFLWYNFPPASDRQSNDHIPKYVNAEDGNITLDQRYFFDLQNRIQCLSLKLKEKEEQIKKLRITTTEKDSIKRNTKINSVSQNRPCNNFCPCSSITRAMLHDHSWINSYKEFFFKNQKCFKNKRVLVANSESGILILLAAKVGAKEVVGLAKSHCIDWMEKIVRENSFQTTIKIVEEKDLVPSRFDVIMSEQRGLPFLASIISARDKYLAPEGSILPNDIALQLVGISDLENHKKNITYWNDVCGFKMATLKSLLVEEPSNEVINSESIITEACTVDTTSIRTKSEDFFFSHRFFLRSKKNSILTALAMYFDLRCDVPEPLTLSTSPHSPPTHWKQTVFYIDEPIPVITGQELESQITCKKSSPYELSVQIEITNITRLYTIKLA